MSYLFFPIKETAGTCRRNFRLLCTQRRLTPQSNIHNISLTQGAVILYMEIWSLPSVRDFDDVGVLCTFNNSSSSSCWDCRKLAAEQPLICTVRKLQMVRPAHHNTNRAFPLDPSPPVRQDRTPHWVGSLQPLASVFSSQHPPYPNCHPLTHRVIY